VDTVTASERLAIDLPAITPSPPIASPEL